MIYLYYIVKWEKIQGNIIDTQDKK